MKGYIIATGTVTHAIKGRDVLRRNGFKARVEKSSSPTPKTGCGYSIVLENGDIEKAEKILREQGVKILFVAKADKQ